MNSLSIARVALGFASMVVLAGSAFAQTNWIPGTEIVGQPVQVTTNGVTDRVVLSAGGQLTITSPNGRVVSGTWTATNGQLCLINGAARECFPYVEPFQAGQPVTVTSSCNAISTWLAATTNIPAAPPPPPEVRGERGR